MPMNPTDASLAWKYTVTGRERESDVPYLGGKLVSQLKGGLFVKSNCVTKCIWLGGILHVHS